MKNFLRVFRLTLFLIDFVLLEAAFFGVYWWRFRTGMFLNPVDLATVEVLVPSLIVSAYWILLLAWFGLYRIDPLHSRGRVAQDAFRAVAFGILILFIVTFNLEDPLPSTRIVLASYGGALFLFVLGNRIGLLTVLRELRVHGVGVWRTLLIGSGERLRSLQRHLSRHPELGAKIEGVLLPKTGHKDTPNDIPVIGTYSRIRSVTRSGRFDTLMFAIDLADEYRLGRMVRALRDLPVRAFIQADQYELLVGAVKPQQVHGHPLTEIRPEVLTIVERFFKRATDILLALLLLVLSLPVWLLLAILIPLDSPGPVFYAQRRVGRGGKEFTLLKFRSMVPDAEARTGAVMAVRDDPRVTRVGRIIRATRLDEIPQVFNVLLGSMSIVGPRPERREFVNQFVKQIPLYERRFNVKPGITGWSQVHLKYDSRADKIDLKLKYDFYYIENVSLPLDMKILLMTLFVIVRGEGL